MVKRKTDFFIFPKNEELRTSGRSCLPREGTAGAGRWCGGGGEEVEEVVEEEEEEGTGSES